MCKFHLIFRSYLLPVATGLLRSDMASRGGIPPRWLNCPRHSELIADKFYAIKTPLDGTFLNQMPPAMYWHPKMILKCFKSDNIGLWIDLTNTTRFYSKDVIESSKVSYVKLQCRGHGECPSPEQTRLFIQMCQKFIATEPLKKIVVHCTHGFNRSGFLICAFLVEYQEWSIDASVNEFAKRRTPGIYKGHYLEELFQRYGDPDDTPRPPDLPEWCFEDGEARSAIDGHDGDDDGIPGQSYMPSSNYRSNSKRDSIGGGGNHSAPSFMKGVEGVSAVDHGRRDTVQKKCAEYCKWQAKGFPGSQPVSMDHTNVGLLFEKPYKVSWKADGTRYLMLIDGPDEVYFVDRDNNVFQAKGVRFPKRKDTQDHLRATLVDGEMIIDEYDGTKIPRYLIYDIIKFETQDVGGCDFNRRMQCIKFEIIDPRETAKREGLINREKEPFGIRMKDFWEITHTKSLLSPAFTSKLSHEIDGLIFQPETDPYKPGQCKDVFKWKPLTHNSIDFRLHIVTEGGAGILPKKVGYLFVGKYEQPFASIRYTKELKDLDKKIVECTFDFNERAWKFMRVRTDKSFPNSYDTAVSVMESIKNPVTKEQLFGIVDKLEIKIKESKQRQQQQQHQNPSHHPPPPPQSSQQSPTSSQNNHQNSSQKRPHYDDHVNRSDSMNNDRSLMPPPPVMRKVA